MRTEIESRKIVAFPEGRVDSTNAGELQRNLDQIMAQNPGLELVLDAGGLAYISSAGLRVLLHVTKQKGSPLDVRNVSPEVYDILDMTGFTSLLHVTKKLREFSVDGCAVIGRGAIGTVYRIDEDTIVKVYEIPDSLPMIENEQKRAKQAFLKGIPTAISYDVVKVGEKYGSVFEMLKATTFNDWLIKEPDNREEIVRQYARFIRQIHGVEMERGELPEAKAVFSEYLRTLRPLLQAEQYDRLCALFEVMPEDLHVVHGDIQMKNVMLSGSEPLLIDMDTLSVGDPVFDLMGLYVTYKLFCLHDPNNSMDFLGLSNEMCDYIWEQTLSCYFEGRSEAAIREAEKRIQLVACVRFLNLVAVQNIGDSALKQRRIKDTLSMLLDLTKAVTSLAVGTI